MTKTITVSTVNELNAALKTSSPKDTILLKGGDYGSFTLSAKSKMDLNFEGVTVKSADPEDPAVFRSMALDGVSNLVVEGVVFDYEFKAGDPAHLRPFSVVNSTGVTIKDSSSTAIPPQAWGPRLTAMARATG